MTARETALRDIKSGTIKHVTLYNGYREFWTVGITNLINHKQKFISFETYNFF